MTKRGWLIGWAAAWFLCGALWAATGVVVTRDGNRYEGEITEEANQVIISIHGAQTVIPRHQVLSIEHFEDFDMAFGRRLAALDPQDVQGRIELARQAMERQRFDLARDTLEETLRIDPNNQQASDLLSLVYSHIRLERNRTEKAAQTETRPLQASGSFPERRTLSPADIDAIRKKELTQNDTAVRVIIDLETRRKFAESQNIPFAQFNAQPMVRQAIEILDKGDESMKQKVRILNDPQSIAEFKRQIQPMILRGCASQNCHGGAGAGGLALLTGQAASDQIAYTNFFILQKYTRKSTEGAGGSVFGGSERRLIDRTRGEQSLLANYGLPREIAELDHPLVNGRPIDPLFRDKNDPGYKALLQWMNKSLVQIEPDYGITYVPAGAATQPAESTAGQAP